MLIELKVSNFAIIENITLSFQAGLNILSGETGSGKSVLLKSLGLLMGEKSNSDSVRTGQPHATVEGVFDLNHRADIKARMEELGIPLEDDHLIVRRVIAAGDKSRVFLNGHASTLSQLRDIVAPLIEVTGPAAPLIEMTGQHENKNLMSKSYHLDLLDQYSEAWGKRNLYEEKYQQRLSALQKITDIQSQSKNKNQRLDYLQFQKQEISALDLAPGEDIELETEVRKLKNSSRLIGLVGQVAQILEDDSEGVLRQLRVLEKKASEVDALDPSFSELVTQRANEAEQILQDVSFGLQKYLNNLDSDPEALEAKEERLSQLRKLQKKYGPDLGDILKSLVEIENEIAGLERLDEEEKQLRKNVEKWERELYAIGTELHQLRVMGGKKLAKEVNKELLDLNMKGVTFHIQVEALQDLHPNGLSNVEFMTQTSAKDPVRPLSKFASGGELSRILLSLKKVVGSSTQPRTYLFDEVDAGVSGNTAEKVGIKLKSIAKGQQVICVTHLPQVAAYGDVHFSINKAPQKGSVKMEVKELASADRVEEIARLISGEKITKTSLLHAKELLTHASS
ncbi:MAG: DNA repair protein RecN [Bdellovibrionota bacterium]